MGVGALSVLLLVAGCRGGRDVPVVDPGSRRTTPSGEVVGFTGRYGSYVWLGLPYAAPPIGDLRWRAPQPNAAWSGVREALQAGAPCVQYASPLGGIQTARANTPVGNEDCLTLNVYAPKSATATSFLPVMVWIHGGGNTIGAGTLYDGGNLAARRDVVVVTVNYRLGPFGWFRHAALRAGAADDVERSGNFGTLDLVRALEWVREPHRGLRRRSRARDDLRRVGRRDERDDAALDAAGDRALPPRDPRERRAPHQRRRPRRGVHAKRPGPTRAPARTRRWHGC